MLGNLPTGKIYACKIKMQDISAFMFVGKENWLAMEFPRRKNGIRTSRKLKGKEPKIWAKKIKKERIGEEVGKEKKRRRVK